MEKVSSLIRKMAGKSKKYNTAVILAAGSGKRLGDDRGKQFVEIDGVPVFVRSIDAFERCPEIHEIILVTRAQDITGCRNIAAEYGFKKLTKIVAGGDTRQSSAERGFEVVLPETDFVAIHDAARCLVTPEMISAVMEKAYVTGAAVAGTKAVDTLKREDLTGNIAETVDRKMMWQVQTPQVFMADMYRAAMYMAKKDSFEGTDDSSLAERLGFKVALVDCGKTNMKITYPEDTVIAEAILGMRGREK